MATSLPTARPLISTFAELHRTDPGRRLFVYVDEHGNDVAELSVDDLARRAEGVRNLLSSNGISPGDRVLLAHLPSLDFIPAFLGCLAAGALPVPVAPPNPFTPDHVLATVSATATGCGARAVLTHRDYLAILGQPPSGSDLPWLIPDSEANPTPELWHRPSIMDEPAYLQFTSGSTGSPKCVTVSHSNVHHELEALAIELGVGPDTVAVTWVPHYHDLGLVCFLLNTLAGNTGRTYLISPLHFQLRPAVWFDVVSRVRATHTSGPGFSFDLMCRKTTEEQRAGWDLSPVRGFGSGGEIMQLRTVERFFTTFASTGLDRASFHPGYGLAEHTMSVTMGTGGPLMVDRDELTRRRVVSPCPDSVPVICYGAGKAFKPGTSLRIVDPETRRPCTPDEVGEIWVDSPTKALGYWGREQETREIFEAVVGDGDPRRYLRTGDLGFLWDGELFVVGRLKDMVILGARYYFPEDIEDAVRDCHPRIRRGGVAVFSHGSTDERLVVLTETAGDPPDPHLVEAIRRAVRARVLDRFGIACDDVVVGQRLVRKTTSGKVRRAVCRDEYLSVTARRTA